MFESSRCLGVRGILPFGGFGAVFSAAAAWGCRSPRFARLEYCQPTRGSCGRITVSVDVLSTNFSNLKSICRLAAATFCVIFVALLGICGVEAASPWPDRLWHRFEKSERLSEADFLVGFDAVFAESFYDYGSAKSLNDRLIEQLHEQLDDGKERDQLNQLFSFLRQYLDFQATSRSVQFPLLAENGPPDASPDFRLRHHAIFGMVSEVNPEFSGDPVGHFDRQLELAQSLDQQWYACQAAIVLYLRDAVAPESSYRQPLMNSLDQLQQDEEDAIHYVESVRAFVNARQQSKLNSVSLFRDLISKAGKAHNTGLGCLFYRMYFDWVTTTEDFSNQISDFDEWLKLAERRGCPMEIGHVNFRLANVYVLHSRLQDHRLALQHAKTANQAWEDTVMASSPQSRDLKKLIRNETALLISSQAATTGLTPDGNRPPGSQVIAGDWPGSSHRPPPPGAHHVLHSSIWFFLFSLTAVVLGVGAWVFVRRCASLSTKLQNQRELQSESQEQIESLEHDLSRITRMDSLGKVAGGVAHDFNNLLTGILSNSELAQMPGVPASERDQLLDGITCSATAAAELCQQILSYSASAPSVVSRFDVNVVINEMMPLLTSGLGRQMDVRFEHPHDSVMFSGDRAGIQQIVLNLVTNAAEACRETSEKHVTVRTGVETPDIRSKSKWFGRPIVDFGPRPFLEVTDTGCGVDDDLVDQMFDPFVTRSAGGQGLGLAVVIGVVRKHHAAVEVATGAGKGTSVRIWFPDLARSASRSGDGTRAVPAIAD